MRTAADSRFTSKADADSRFTSKADADSRVTSKADADSRFTSKADADYRITSKADARESSEAKYFSASALLVKLTRESLRQSGGIWRPREWNSARKGAHFTGFTSEKIRDTRVQKYVLTRKWNSARQTTKDWST